MDKKAADKKRAAKTPTKPPAKTQAKTPTKSAAKTSTRGTPKKESVDLVRVSSQGSTFRVHGLRLGDMVWGLGPAVTLQTSRNLKESAGLVCPSPPTLRT